VAYRSIQDTVAISESLSRLSRDAECCYWRMLAQTDTYGRLPGSATKIKGLCMPLVEVTVEQVHAWLIELRDSGRIVLYFVDGKPYLYFVDFEDHQPAEFKRKRGKAKYPAPPEEVAAAPIERLGAATIGAPATDVSALGASTAALEESREEESTKATTAARPRDEVWDWLEERFGTVVPSTQAHGKRNKACGDLKKLGATTQTLDVAIRAWPTLFQGASPTDIAVATHYPQLTAGVNGSDLRKSAQSWFENVGQHLPIDAFDEELAAQVNRGLDGQTAAELRAQHRETAGV
jgi:hypothetical protein